jgi:hypothetical protein
MVFDVTFSNIAIHGGGQFYWWRKPEYMEKTTDATHWQTLSHSVVSNASRPNGIQAHNVSGNMHRLHMYC